MIGVIQNISAKGKSNVIKVDGADYWIKGDIDISAMKVGGKLDFTYSPNVYNGKTYNWIKNWGAIPPDAPAPAPSRPNAVPVAHAPHAQESAFPCEWSNLLSNLLAHLTDKGLIETPQQIYSWVRGTKLALEGKEMPSEADIP